MKPRRIHLDVALATRSDTVIRVIRPRDQTGAAVTGDVGRAIAMAGFAPVLRMARLQTGVAARRQQRIAQWMAGDAGSTASGLTAQFGIRARAKCRRSRRRRIHHSMDLVAIRARLARVAKAFDVTAMRRDVVPMARRAQLLLLCRRQLRRHRHQRQILAVVVGVRAARPMARLATVQLGERQHLPVRVLHQLSLLRSMTTGALCLADKCARSQQRRGLVLRGQHAR